MTINFYCKGLAADAADPMVSSAPGVRFGGCQGARSKLRLSQMGCVLKPKTSARMRQTRTVSDSGVGMIRISFRQKQNELEIFE